MVHFRSALWGLYWSKGLDPLSCGVQVEGTFTHNGAQVLIRLAEVGTAGLGKMALGLGQLLLPESKGEGGDDKDRVGHKQALLVM